MSLHNQRTLTNKTLAVRLALTLAVLFGITGAVVYKFSAEIINRFNLDERASLLASIESGPLQLARLNSAELASTYLKRLSVEANAQNPSIVGTEIASGVDGKDIYATWSIGRTAAACLTKVSKSISFPDGINPYTIRLTLDNCASRESLNQVTKLCILVAIFLVLITGAASILAALPVFRSLRMVSAMLDTVSEEEDSKRLSKIDYLPLRQLGGKVIENRKLVQEAAVARMTGMLAHDVRKPFSILRMGLGMLNSAKDPASVKRVLSRLIPEIDKAVSSVDGLIADVMEVGSTSTQLIQEPVSPESLIEATLGETFRIYPKSDIAINYDFRHSHMVNVHIQKVGRVFSNIVGNAVQAMGYKGDIWFKSRERDGIVEFCLGNAGSVIPHDSLPKLFDAFFTSGKKGGTGLGLAIAQKVVTAHGGRIWCESSKTLEHPDGKVEFFFTLPVAEGLASKNTATLPNHSSDITKALALMAATAESGEGSIDKGELTLEADIIQAAKKNARPLHVLVIDDEAIYRSGLASYLSRTPELEAAIILEQADGSNAALSAMAGTNYDLIITDVDMGCYSLNGFELVRKLRESGRTGMICVHSNRIVAEDHKTAIEAGADAFLPKPMARGHLLKLVLQAFPTQLAKNNNVVALSKQVAEKRPEVLVVEDNVFMLEAWEDMLKGDAIVYAFASPEALVAKMAEDDTFLERLSCVITDMNFDGSMEDGYGVAKIVKDKRSAIPVLLCTDGDYNSTPGDLIDQVIAKDPVKYINLPIFH